MERQRQHGLDVIFLVHGSNGYAKDWMKFADFLDLHFEESAKIYACKSNEGKKTDDGILVCGKRLTDEIVEYLQGSMEGGASGYLRLNFVTVGLGGLIVRAALRRLYIHEITRPCENVQWQSFLSISCPHLGRLKKGLSLGGMLRMASNKLGYKTRTSLDLSHTSTVLRQLCSNDEYILPFKKFQVRTLISVVDGGSTPYASSSLCSNPGYDFNLLSSSALKTWDFPRCCGIVGVYGPYPCPTFDKLMFDTPTNKEDWDPLTTIPHEGNMRIDVNKRVIFPPNCLNNLRQLMYRNIDIAMKLPVGYGTALNSTSKFLICKDQPKDIMDDSEKIVDKIAQIIHFDSKIFVSQPEIPDSVAKPAPKPYVGEPGEPGIGGGVCPD